MAKIEEDWDVWQTREGGGGGTHTYIAHSVCYIVMWEQLMFSFNHSLLPPKFNNYFSLNKQVHSYATRYANDFHLPFCRTNLRKFSVSFQGPTYYNSLETDIKEEIIFNFIRHQLTTHTYSPLITSAFAINKVQILFTFTLVRAASVDAHVELIRTIE